MVCRAGSTTVKLNMLRQPLPSQVKVSVHQLGQGSNNPLLQRSPAATNTQDSSLLLGSTGLTQPQCSTTYYY